MAWIDASDVRAACVTCWFAVTARWTRVLSWRSVSGSPPMYSLISASAPGLAASRRSSRWVTWSAASSKEKPRPSIGTTTMGMSWRAASSISRMHHGRVSTSFVPRTTSTSDCCTPSVKSRLRSARSDESRKTGAFAIRWSRSRRYRASLPASFL